MSTSRSVQTSGRSWWMGTARQFAAGVVASTRIWRRGRMHCVVVLTTLMLSSITAFA